VQVEQDTVYDDSEDASRKYAASQSPVARHQSLPFPSDLI
jgi:hypothetical protein